MKNFSRNFVQVTPKKSLGQGMTEYIIATALVAIAAITVFGFMGDTVENQMAVIAAELGGDQAGATTARGAATTSAAAAAARAGGTTTLSDFEQ